MISESMSRLGLNTCDSRDILWILNQHFICKYYFLFYLHIAACHERFMNILLVGTREDKINFS